jgi:predicted RNA-binding protein
MPLDLYERYEESAKEEHIEFKGPAGLIYIIKGLSNNLEQLLDEQNRLLNDLRKKETVNIDSIKAQILTIAKDKIKSQRDLKEFMFEVNDLLNEIV